MSLRRRTYPEVLESLLTTIDRRRRGREPPVPAAGLGAAAALEPARAAARDRRRRPAWGARDGRAARVPQGRRLRAVGRRHRDRVAGGGRRVPRSRHARAGQLRRPGAGPRSPTSTSAASCGRCSRRPRSSWRGSTRMLEAVYDVGVRRHRDRQRRSTTSSRCSASSACAAGAGGRGRVQRARPGAPARSRSRPARASPPPTASVEYETHRRRSTMAPGQGRSASRCATSSERPAAGRRAHAAAGADRGIVGVTNPAPTAIAAQDETDAELRTRAKNFLHGSERATLGALEQAIARAAASPPTSTRVDRARAGHVTPHVDVARAGATAAAADRDRGACARPAWS